MKDDADQSIVGLPPDQVLYGTEAPTIGAGIRERLRVWADVNETDDTIGPIRGKKPFSEAQYAQNVITQSGEDDLTSFDTAEEGKDEDYEFMNQDLVDLDSNSEITGVSPGQDYFVQGDLVEIQSSQALLAIFVKSFTKQKCLLYVETGRWMICDRRRPLFSMSRFVHPHILNDLLPFIPSIESIDSQDDLSQIENQSPPRLVGQRAREHLLSFRATAEGLYRRFADRLDRSYKILAPDTNEEGSKTLTLEHSARILFQLGPDSRPTPEMLWTVHRTLSNEPSVSFSRHNHRQNPRFDFIPKENHETLLIVQKWVREYQEMRIQSSVSPQPGKSTYPSHSGSTPIESFAQKAQDLVAKSREQQRSCSSRLKSHDFLKQYSKKKAKSSTKINLKTFDQNDEAIIDYLRAWTASHIVHKLSPMNSVGPAILRAVGTYDGIVLDQETGYTFLQELGVIAPWQSPTLFTMPAGLPGFSNFHPANRLQREAQQEARNYQIQDSMADFRRDWGQLPVYCIDSATTAEIDDGLSIEPVPETNDAWLHMHIANPTAYIKPESAAARFADKMTQTVYLSEMRIPMLDPSLTEEHLSLGKGKPCITFSARVNAQGEVLQDAISHGIIHNVYYLTPEDVDEALDLAPRRTSFKEPILSVGKPPPRAQKDSINAAKISRPLTKADVEQLIRLRTLTALMNNQVGIVNGTVMYRDEDKSLKAIETVIQLADPPSDSHVVNPQGMQFADDPFITLSHRTSRGTEISKTVGHLMVLAGKICAAWCAKRSIPVPYRGFILNPQPALKLQIAEKDLSSYLHSSRSDKELASRVQQIQELGFTTWSASPAEHPLLNSSAYVQATSPLRRYGDMILHWQIESALRLEKEHGSSFITDANRSSLPFSHGMVAAASRNFVTRHWQQRELQNKSRRHWFVMAFYRAFYSQEAELPRTLSAKLTRLVNNPFSPGVRGQLLDYWEDVRFDCEDASIGPDSNFRLNDIWEVQIRDISVYRRTIHVIPIRLLERVH